MCTVVISLSRARNKEPRSCIGRKLCNGKVSCLLTLLNRVGNIWPSIHRGSAPDHHRRSAPAGCHPLERLQPVRSLILKVLAAVAVLAGVTILAVQPAHAAAGFTV